MRAHILFVVAALVLLGCPSVSGTDAGAEECPSPTGSGTEHSGRTALNATETWTAAAGPHILTGDLRIVEGGTLVIDPCVEVRMRGPRVITVQSGGKLHAEGTEKRPIRVVPEDATKRWGFVQVFGPGSARLAYTTIEGGGSEPVNAYGALEARGDQLAPAQEILFVDHLTVKNSANYGVSLRAGATFTRDSRDLVITGSAKAPLRVIPRVVSNLPSGTYTGNTQDVVQVETEAYGDVTLEDVTFRDLGIPYVVGGGMSAGQLKVGGGAKLVKLTLEPGVILKFAKNNVAGIEVESGTTDDPAKGALVAVGTLEKPIVLTSASDFPIAGDWRGLTFGNRPDAQDKLDFVHLEYAGAPSQANGFHCVKNGLLSKDEDAALSLYGQPTHAFVTNSLFRSSAGLGVNLAYKGMNYDFLSSNTFIGVVGCKQSTPRNQDGSCPSDVSCP
jgi:hypothetical protein